MKKVFGLLVGMFLLSGLTFGQLIDEKNVTVTMDLQPVLQLHMTTPDQIDFTFDEIKDYYGGIIKYAATILKVSSSVTWDLYAVGTSQNGTNWDQQVSYSSGGGANSINTLPLSALELHQYEPNQYDANATGPQSDYSTPFAPAQTLAVGINSIYYSGTPYTAPGDGEKYIQGHKGTSPGDDGAPGGSYLTSIAPAGTFSDYYFTIDYRILP
ncbi:MAG: hypothetical protein ACUVQP_12245, partial [Bacteroidales bacterium]